MGLPYTALDLAALLSFQDLGIRAEAALLEKIWVEEQTFLAPDLAKSRRTFLLDVAYWSLYLREKPCIDREFPVIQRDAADCGAHLSEESFLSDFSNLDLYFKEMRFRLRFFSDCGYVRHATEAVWISSPLRQAVRAFGAVHGILSVAALSSGWDPL